MTERPARVGFYPGTFDPITYGHMDVITRAERLLDRLVIGVAAHSGKTPLLDVPSRVACIETAIAPLRAAGASIDVIGFDTLLVDAVRAHGAGVVVRGLRAVADFDYESQMSGMNRQLAPDIETIFLMAAEQHRCVASHMVKEVARLGGDITPFVPDCAREMVHMRLSAERIAKRAEG